MTTEAIEKFKELFAEFKASQSYADRQAQKVITPVFKAIIWETLQNEKLTNQHLTGLIQMFGWRCKPENFRKYMALCVKNKARRAELIVQREAIIAKGFTNIGKTAITKLTPQNRSQIRDFLIKAFSTETIQQAETLCKAFERQNIPEVTKGVFSPWLFYINPTIFPLVNNSHKNFQKFFTLSKAYSDNINEYHVLNNASGEKDLAAIDMIAHLFTADGELNFRRYLYLNGNRIYKISHGMFSKHNDFKDSGLWQELEKRKWICMNEGTGKNRGNNFANVVNVGDFVYLCYGGEELGMIGRIVSDPKPLPDLMKESINRLNEPWIYREVEELFKPKRKWLASDMKAHTSVFMPSGYSTFAEIPLDKIDWVSTNLFIPYYNVSVIGHEPTDEEDDINTETEILNSGEVNAPQNIILYGPPGTGKTYHTITHAVAIIEEADFETIASEERDEVRRRFDVYVTEGKIVFTTFHQSLGYEDFIEGIKPVAPGEATENIQYEVKDGIFKKLATNAAFTIAQDLEQPEDGYLKSFDLVYDAYIAQVSEQLDKGEKVTLASKSDGTLIVDSISDFGNLLVKHSEETRTYTVSKNRLSKLDAAFPNLDEVSNIYKAFRSVIGGSNASAYWAVLNAIRELEPMKIEANLDAYDYSAQKSVVQSIPTIDFGKAKGKPFVLIIDEINRGNIAQIFGELITLIEPDKRMGLNEGLTVTLPYSEETFGVPHNLHIIGTMNTADRSVEALDTALRRRFSFKHLVPEPERLEPTIEGIDLELMLTAMNDRLSILKDNDHTIGHAWFMENNVDKDVEWLKGIFGNKIFPLLQEYFYGDYEKIGLVLGEQFFEKANKVDTKVFALFKKGNNQAQHYAQAWQYKLKAAVDLKEEDFTSIYEGNTSTSSESDEDE